MADPTPPANLDPAAIAPHYARFRVTERLLLTGHSTRRGPTRRSTPSSGRGSTPPTSWTTSGRRPGRWPSGCGTAGVADRRPRRRGRPRPEHAQLLVRWLSALPLDRRRRLVTTDGEFHTIRRQLDRLRRPASMSWRWGAARETLAERLIRSERPDRRARLVGAVRDGRIVPGLSDVAAACARVGAELLVDAYHHRERRSVRRSRVSLGHAYVVGGG